MKIKRSLNTHTGREMNTLELEIDNGVSLHFVKQTEADGELLLIFQSMTGCSIEVARRFVGGENQDLEVFLFSLIGFCFLFFVLFASVSFRISFVCICLNFLIATKYGARFFLSNDFLALCAILVEKLECGLCVDVCVGVRLRWRNTTSRKSR